MRWEVLFVLPFLRVATEPTFFTAPTSCDLQTGSRGSSDRERRQRNAPRVRMKTGGVSENQEGRSGGEALGRAVSTAPSRPLPEEKTYVQSGEVIIGEHRCSREFGVPTGERCMPLRSLGTSLHKRAEDREENGARSAS